MFPGTTLTDMRLRQQDLLSDGGYEPVRRRVRGEWIVDQYPRLDRFFVQIVASLLAALGL